MVGDGVSKGYHNRDDLTNKVFIKNPFDRKSLIYDTKDLAYFNYHGEIIHLGRSDFQAKIHGFRIELGEIEYVIHKYPQITNAVALLQDNDLNAFIVSNEKINSEDLKNFLKQFLPHYMIPKNIFQISQIPLTPNGKIDRKNSIFTNASLNNENTKLNTKKINSQEELLLNIISNEIKHNITIYDNIFEIGIDSLSIIKIINLLYNYNITLSIQDFYDFPSIYELSKHIKNKQANIIEDYYKVPTINNISNFKKIINNYKKIENPTILLTGATGFLGIHVLNYIINNTNSTVYCLIRKKENKNAKERLHSKLQYYFNRSYKELLNDKIFIIETDITEKQLGIDSSLYNDLGKKIDMVIHCAADVKHYGDYNSSSKANIKTTDNIIKFCTTFNKILNHISTMTVSGYGLVNIKDSKIFDEDILNIGQNFNDNIYVKTKLIAETKILKSLNKGLLANIFRIGTLTNDYKTKKFQLDFKRNALMNELKLIKNLEIIPNSLKNFNLDFTPVDFCAEAIVKLCMIQNFKYNINVYHLYNNNYVNISTIKNLLPNIKCVDDNEFKKIASRKQDEYIIGLPEFYSKLNLLKIYKRNNFNSNNISCEKTLISLNNLDFKWPILNDDYILTILRGL